MKIVAFDTSTKYLTIACLEDAEVKATYHEDAGTSHSELLVPTIKDLASGILVARWPLT